MKSLSSDLVDPLLRLVRGSAWCGVRVQTFPVNGLLLQSYELVLQAADSEHATLSRSPEYLVGLPSGTQKEPQHGGECLHGEPGCRDVGIHQET